MSLCCVSPWQTDDGHNFLLRVLILHCFPGKRMTRSWSPEVTVSLSGTSLIPDDFFWMTLEIDFPTRLKGGKVYNFSFVHDKLNPLQLILGRGAMRHSLRVAYLVYISNKLKYLQYTLKQKWRELLLSIFIKCPGHIVGCSVMRTWNMLSRNPVSIFIREVPDFPRQYIVLYRHRTPHIVQISYCCRYCLTLFKYALSLS